MYPRDRVVQNQIARILFLKRDYAAAVKALERVCLIDPEDVQVHYTLMLAYRGLKDTEKAAREELARVYADDCQRPEMAIAELEELVAQPLHDTLAVADAAQATDAHGLAAHLGVIAPGIEHAHRLRALTGKNQGKFHMKIVN